MPVAATIEKLPEGRAVVTLSGGMTQGTSLKTLDAQVQGLLAEGNTHLVLDLSNIEYADSAGLGFLVHTFGLTKAAGGSLRLCGTGKHVRRLLEMTTINTFLPMDANRDESLLALKSSS